MENIKFLNIAFILHKLAEQWSSHVTLRALVFSYLYSNDFTIYVKDLFFLNHVYCVSLYEHKLVSASNPLELELQRLWTTVWVLEIKTEPSCSPGRAANTFYHWAVSLACPPPLYFFPVVFYSLNSANSNVFDSSSSTVLVTITLWMGSDSHRLLCLNAWLLNCSIIWNLYKVEFWWSKQVIVGGSWYLVAQPYFLPRP